MNGFQPYPSGNDSAPPSQPRTSMDLSQNGRRASQRNAMPMPVTGPQHGLGTMPGEQGFGPMGVPRSPPKNKNTQLVPCKFFLQGTCQAGRTCPFSHDVEASTKPAPCKYFARGGCKFGRKCMLLHITPDGIVLNRPPMFSQIPPGQPFAGAPPNGTFQPPPPGLLSLQAQGLDPQRQRDMPSEYENYPYSSRNGLDRPPVDMTYTSASPTYGSPPHDNRFANSPPGQGLSVLDAPLPNSFDSNGISMAARNGPFAASVPSRFGVESPPASLPRKSQLGNTALRDLHNSAFGGQGMDGMILAGSSPPSGPDEPLTFPKRPLHSERLRDPRHQMISASLGTKLPTQSFEYSDEEDDDHEDVREDLLPASLRDLLPARKSMADDENTPASFLAAQRRTISGPQEGKFGSPHSSSPSRYTGNIMRSYSGRADWEGQVGSPLRNTSSYFTASAPRTSNGDLSPTISSPPRQASMSILTKELQRTKLDPGSAPVGMTRTASNGSTGRTSLDRALSTNSVGRERIEEEQELFDMDEVGDAFRSDPRPVGNNSARSSGQWSTNRGREFGSSPGNEPTFGAIGGHRTSK